MNYSPDRWVNKQVNIKRREVGQSVRLTLSLSLEGNIDSITCCLIGVMKELAHSICIL